MRRAFYFVPLLVSGLLVAAISMGQSGPNYLRTSGGTVRGPLYLNSSSAFTTSALAAGELALNNGAGDTPGIHFYKGNNSNMAIDVSGSTMRFLLNGDESGGVVLATLDTNGNWVSASTTGTQFNCTGAATCAHASASGQAITVDTGGGTATASIGAANATTTTVGRSGQTTNINGGVQFGTHLTCTMAAATTCTVAVRSGAACTCQATSGTAIAQSCSVASTTATCTANGSNSNTWNVLAY